MEYAVILRFDEAAEMKAFHLINAVATASSNMYMVENGIPPHVSLAIFTKENDTGVIDTVTDFAKQLNHLETRFDSIAVFNPQVIFLAPVVTAVSCQVV